MAQPKVAKKSARHRKDKSLRTQCARPSHHEQATHDGRGMSDAPDSVTALAGPADAPSTALVPVRPLHPAVCEHTGQAAPADHAAHGKKCTAITFARALLMSVALTAALILGLSMIKRVPAEMQVARLGADAGIADATSAGNTVSDTPARRTLTAAKARTSSPRQEIEARHADTRRTSTPVAQKASEAGKTGKASKMEVHKLAKAPARTQDARKAKAHEPHATVTDGQHGTVLASKGTGAANSYAQCQALDGFLRREQCKWQVCNGKWGQDGCPSYAHANTDIN